MAKQNESIKSYILLFYVGAKFQYVFLAGHFKLVREPKILHLHLKDNNKENWKRWKLQSASWVTSSSQSLQSLLARGRAWPLSLRLWLACLSSGPSLPFQPHWCPFLRHRNYAPSSLHGWPCYFLDISTAVPAFEIPFLNFTL